MLLDRVVAHRPHDVRAVLLLGVTREDAGDFAGARQLYQRLLAGRTAPRLRAELRARLVELHRREALAFVQQAVAREAELRNTPPRPHTLAIFPLVVSSPDTSLRPLGRAFTALLATDLSQTRRLTVLDRLSVQLLAEEIKLDRSGLVDPATAARGGRLLGAAHVVDGALLGDTAHLRVDAAVVAMTPGRAPAGTPGAGARSLPPSVPRPGRRDSLLGRSATRKTSPVDVMGRVTAKDPLSRLFDMEKRTALELYATLGVQLTPTERQAVLERRTTSVQALLAYGRGLEAEDAGDYGAAARDFREAVRLDPHFAPARQQLATTSTVASAGQVTTGTLAAQATSPGPVGGNSAVMVPTAPAVPLERNPVTASLGTEGSPSTTIIDILIQRPGGGR